MTAERLEEFSNYMIAIKGRSEGSMDGYILDLTKFLEFLYGDKKVTDKELQAINKGDAYRYLSYCTKNGNSPKTRSRKVSSIRVFFKYLDYECGIHNDVYQIEKPKTEKTIPKYLTIQECKTLLDTARNSTMPERNVCIITLFVNCGMRLSELANIKVSDIRTDNTLVINGKGNKERLVYLNDMCVNALNEYLAVRPNVSFDDLWVNKSKKPLTRRGVQQEVTNLLHKSGFDDYSTHKLRHTAATLMYHNGVGLLEIQEILGHSNINTTQMYTHTNKQSLMNAVSCNPLNQEYNDNVVVLQRKLA